MEKQRFQTISRQTPRLESVQKAIGAGTYTDDLRMPDMAYAELIRCPYSHARVIAIDASQAEKIPGFLGIATPEDAPQAFYNCSGNPSSPQKRGRRRTPAPRQSACSMSSCR